MELLGWFKRVKPVGKRLLRLCANPENELVELVKKGRSATWTKCELDCTNLYKVLHIIATLISTGKIDAAGDFCRAIAQKCFDEDPENPYRLIFLSFSMIADCETRFYDLNIFPLNPKDLSLKRRYSICQQASSGILEMEPTIFKVSDLLTMSEEFAHFACFRQCHVNLLKHLSELGEDENVDWFDIVKVLDSNILALINDSDIGFRLCDTDKEKKEFQQNLQRIQSSSLEENDQYCYSWFNHLHLREICVRSTAAIEVLKSDQAYKTFVRNQTARNARTVLNPGRQQRKHRRRLQPQNPELEEKEKRISFGEDSGVLADTNMVILRKNSKTLTRRKKNSTQKVYSTDTEDLNYCISLFDDCKSFSDINEDAVEAKSYQRKDRERSYNIGGSEDCRKRMPESVRRKIRIILRKMMAEGREIQKKTVVDDDLLNKAFPVTDDECSDEEIAPHPFQRTETLETIRRRKMRKFGTLNPKSDAKHVLWWHNAKDELLTIRAIANHCVKITGDSSEPFATFEEYMGKSENGEKLRDRMTESKREAKCRAFNIKREIELDDGALLTMSAADPFKECRVNKKRTNETIGLNSLLLQNMRRKCIDELLILLMIVKGQQQLQDGNVIRCLAYLMLIDYKLAVFRENTDLSPAKDNNFYPYLMQLHKRLFSKFRLYGSDLFGDSCTTEAEEQFLHEEDNEDLKTMCRDFCRETQAYFFCICIRGKVVQLYEDRPELDRKDIEMQHEFFFGLDLINKNSHLNSFWRTECMPIVSGLLHLVDHSLLEKIDAMNPVDAAKIMDNIPDLSPQTRQWLRQVTKHGYLKQPTKPDIYKTGAKSVPILFQVPSRSNDENNPDYMVSHEDLYYAYQETTDFVQEKQIAWKRACQEDEDNIGKTNRDMKYYPETDLMFFGESIEKHVYMVAVYKGEKSTEDQELISDQIRSMCRKLRSQSGFISIKNFCSAKDSE